MPGQIESAAKRQDKQVTVSKCNHREQVSNDNACNAARRQKLDDDAKRAERNHAKWKTDCDSVKRLYHLIGNGRSCEKRERQHTDDNG